MLQHNSLNGKNGIYEFYSSVNNQSQIELMSKPNFYSDYCDGSKILSVNHNPITIHRNIRRDISLRAKKDYLSRAHFQPINGHIRRLAESEKWDK